MNRGRHRLKKLVAASLSMSFLGAAGFLAGGYADEVSAPDIIEVSTSSISFNTIAPGGGRIISFKYILETGEVPGDTILGSPKLYDIFFSALSVFSSPHEYTNYYIDWDADDAFTQAIGQIKSTTLARIQNDRNLWPLLNKPVWGRGDRLKWEKAVSKIITQQISEINGLRDYRTTGPFGQGDEKVEMRSQRLNDVSLDIERMKDDAEGDVKPLMELDCEGYSIIVGGILEKIDKQLLPDHASDGDYKRAASYYYVLGKLNDTVFENTLGRHAFVFSSTTGSVIEGTDRNPDGVYRENKNQEYGLENLRQGEIIQTVKGNIYASRNAQIGEVAALRIETGELDISDLYNRIDVEWREGDVVAITEDECVFLDIPAELKELAYLKWRSVGLEEGHGNMSLQQSKTAEQLIDLFRQKFDERIEENIQNGGIYSILNFFQKFEDGSKDKDARMVQVSEIDMHPVQ